MRRLGFAAAAVLVAASAASGQPRVAEFGGVDTSRWLRKPISSAADTQRLADFHKQFEDIGPAARSLVLRGEYAAARKKYEELLGVTRELFTADSPIIAMAYGAVAAAAEKAGDSERACEYGKLFFDLATKAVPPGTTFPGGQEMLARATENYGMILAGSGKGEEGEKLLRSALQLWREIHGADSDHRQVIVTLVNLAVLHHNRNAVDDAEKSVTEALGRCTRLCGTPDGLRENRELFASCKNSMAQIHLRRGRKAEADALAKEAVDLTRAPTSAPDALALRIRNQAMTHLEGKEYDAALRGFREAHDILDRTFPPRDYPNGHPELLRIHRDVAVCLDQAGRPAEAVSYHRTAVEMALRLYPSERFPDGHTELAYALTNLGSNRLRGGDPDDAARTFRFALDMWLAHIDRQAGGLAETDVLNLLDSVPGVLHGLLTAGADRPFDDRDYRYVWASKAGVMRVLEARRRVDLARGTMASKVIADRLADVRAKLAVELTRSGGTAAAELTREREALERRLADELKMPPPTRTTPAALQAKLPATAAFVDFWKYLRLDKDKVEAEYVAFVVTPAAVVRVPLGSAVEIDRAAEHWLGLVETGTEVDERVAAQKVSDLVWKPLSSHIPSGMTKLYLSPDSDLARVPFAAVPASRDELLIDRYELACVPHGPFLLDLLTRGTAPSPPSANPPLVVGGVKYGEKETPWATLQFTATEREAVAEVLKDARPLSLSGEEATVRRVLAELPNAGAAHFATHAVFDNPTRDTAGFTLIDPRSVRPSVESATPLFVKSPLALTALVLAGANRFADRSNGYLSGEAVAGLRLEKLRFVVLSACESARGVVYRGEGVFGFQRAFHVAGCPCVVGSLWKVNDLATAALMSRFYTHLNAGRSNIPAALRQAQQDVRKNPEKVGEWTRGIGDIRVAVPGGTRVPGGGTPNTTRSWAAFSVSGF